jgi:hypothetical protein
MRIRYPKLGLVILVLTAGLCLCVTLGGKQQRVRAQAPDANADVPPVPKGVEVMCRGPVHEAFASPTTDPVPSKAVAKAPPQPLDEMPPEQKPEGEVVWIGGYWAWDDDRNDFLWVSGVWRTPPPGKRWVPGYWKEDNTQHQWVPGIWVADEQQQQAPTQAAAQVNYLPEPPKPPDTAAPGEAPSPESFYVPGHWQWRDAGYVTVGGVATYHEAGYAWAPGYWARVQPGYVWVPAHYRWTPMGFIYVAGYWDLAISRRGIVYAPVVVDPAYVGVGFVYTPAYAISDTVMIDAMFVRPCFCHYYFGDYYGVAYAGYGYESVVVFGRAHYDPIFSYAVYEHRYEPGWVSVQLDITLGRRAGRYEAPPRTLVQQNTYINNTTIINNTTVNNTNINHTSVNRTAMVMPAARVAAAKSMRTVAIDNTTRMQARQQAQAIQQVAAQRSQTEVRSAGGRTMQPKTASFSVPKTQPVMTKQEAAQAAVRQQQQNAARANNTAGTNQHTSQQAAGHPGYQPGHPGAPGPNPGHPIPNNQQMKANQRPMPKPMPKMPPQHHEQQHKSGDQR